MSLYRWSLIACVLLFTAGGLATASTMPVTYTAQGQLLAAGTSVSAAAVPSFAQAGQSLAQTYSRVFGGDQVQKKLTADGVDLSTVSVTASPIASTSVILIEAQAPSAAAASRAADAGVTALASTVSGLLDNSSQLARTREVLKDAYRDQVKAQTALDVLNRKKNPEGSKAYQDATADLGEAKTTVEASGQLLSAQVAASVQANGVSPLTSAHLSGSTSSKRYETWGAIGLIAGVAVWIVIALLRSRSLHRGPGAVRKTTA